VSLVLDSSATLAWIFADEATEWVRGVFHAVAVEIANSLTGAVRRRRIDREYRRAALADLGDLDIIVDAQTDSRAWNATLEFADRFLLTVYMSNSRNGWRPH
jgi:predicted nucleic acid-binding protein